MSIPFSPPYIDDSVISEVVDSLKSGWITTGPKVRLLEQEVKSFCGAGEVLCVNSWTSGAIMVLRWLGIAPGDEVIIPAYTYVATANAVLHAGGVPVMVDCGEDFNVSVEAIEAAITPRTKAIMPVDIAGYPCDYKSILELAEKHKGVFKPTSKAQEMLGRIMVISDAAHSLGASYAGVKVGANADIVIFSLHAVKNVTTAEGGAICLNLPEPFHHEQLCAHLRQMSLNFQTKDAFSKSKAGGWEYDIMGLGMKCNMADVNAAIGLAQMRQYPALLAERKRVFEQYSQVFAQHNWAITPPSTRPDGTESSYHLYALRIKGIGEQQRNVMIEKIAENGVAVNVHFKPLPMLSCFTAQGLQVGDFPVAFGQYQNEISLPIYPQLTTEQVDYVVQSVVNAYQKTV